MAELNNLVNASEDESGTFGRVAKSPIRRTNCEMQDSTLIENDKSLY